MARIVFDLDGTLIDSAPDIRLAANGALEGTGAAPLSLEETRGFVGSGAPVFVERMICARELPMALAEGLLARFLTQYEGAVHLTMVYPGVVDALQALLADGHRLGICTNKPVAPTHAVLAYLGLARFFEVVFGGDSLAERKPDPAPLHAAFSALGQGQTLYVGDSEVDAETASRAGVSFVLFTQGYRHALVEELPHAARFDDWLQARELVSDLVKGVPALK